MRLSLRYKLGSIVLLAAIPFLVYAVYHYISSVNENKKVAVANNLAKARGLSKEIAEFIDSSQNVLYSLAMHPAIANNDSAKCDEIFSQLLPLYPLHLNILAADMQGRNFASAIDPQNAHKLVYIDKEWFKLGSKGVSIVSDLHTSKLFIQPAFMITMPVFNKSGNQSAVLGFPVNLQKLRDHFLEAELVNPNTSTYLIDNKGNILFNTADAQQTGQPFAQPGILQRINKENTGSITDFDPQGTKRFYSHATVETTGWKVLVEIPESELYADANLAAVRNLFFFLLICLTGGMTALFFSRQLVDKVELIIKGLNEVAAGNFACRLNVPGTDEIAHASDAFNRMTAERARAEEEIMNFTATLEKTVEIRTAELTRAKNELEAFSFAVSHDLQAPVRHILSFAQILLDDHESKLSANSRDCLMRINRSGLHMRDLITHLLELSRLNRQELNRMETDIGSICRNICQEFAADDPSRRVEVEIADGLITCCDPNLVLIVMENLLGNAWKYTRKVANPHIEVGKTDHNGVRCFFIKDNGTGFDMAYADKLFTPFNRLHSADEFEGTGVGLATVMRIIQRHEGSIWAESAQGKGAAFYFTLTPEA